MKKVIFSLPFLFSLLFSSQIDMLMDACMHENGSACEEIGLLYNEGIGFDKNSSQAKKYFIKACEYGVDHACERLDMIQK